LVVLERSAGAGVAALGLRLHVPICLS
jgi:hypothetical protein